MERLRQWRAALSRRWNACVCRFLRREGARLLAGRPSLDARFSLFILRLLAKTPRPGAERAIDAASLEALTACVACGASHPAMAENGLIGDQRPLARVRFGTRGNTAEHGCGWIAAYNARRLLGEDVRPETVLSDLRRGARSGGRMGADPFFLLKYFRALGYSVRLCTAAEEMERESRACDAFILCYLYTAGDGSPGGHFAAGAFDPAENGFRVYNGERGKAELCAAFLSIAPRNTQLRLLLAIRRSSFSF